LRIGTLRKEREREEGEGEKEEKRRVRNEWSGRESRRWEGNNLQ